MTMELRSAPEQGSGESEASAMSLASPMRTSSSVQSVAGRIADRVFLARKRFPFATNVATLSGGASLGHCFTLAAAPVLTRLYLPHELGSLGLFNAFLGV